jgi:hypothetical protein
MRHLKLGPALPYRTGKNCHIALEDVQQIGSDFLVTRECSSLAEFEAEVAGIKEELDRIHKEARTAFAS